MHTHGECQVYPLQIIWQHLVSAQPSAFFKDMSSVVSVDLKGITHTPFLRKAGPEMALRCLSHLIWVGH